MFPPVQFISPFSYVKGELMKTIWNIIMQSDFSFLGLFLVITLIFFSCTGGGGGGGSDVDIDQPFEGDTGTGADDVTIFWQYFGEIGGGYHVEQTAENGFVFAGEKGSDYTFTTQNMFLAKSDSQGVLAWSRTFGGEGGQTARDLTQCSDGGFLAVGYTDSGSSRNVYAVRTDADGNLLWSKSYDAQGGDDEGHAVNVLSNGYAIAGSGVRDKGGGQMSSDVWFFKIDDNGDKISGSDHFYDSTIPGWYRAYAMEKTRDNGFVMTGRGEPNAISVIKISGDGAQVWNNAYGTGVGYAVRQAASPDNGFIVAGSTTPFDCDESDVLIIKLDAGGNEQWRKVFGGSGMDVGQSVALTPDNGYLIAGLTQSFSQSDFSYLRDDVYLINLAANGNLRWQKVKGQSPDNSERAYDIQATKDGGYIITGSSQSQVMLAKFDKNGNTVKLGEHDFTYIVPDAVGLITLSNALDIAETAANAVFIASRTGNIGLNLFINTLNGFPSTDFCDNDGSYSWSPVPASPVSEGNSYRLSFSSCSNSDLEALYSGSFKLTVNDLDGDLTDHSYDITVTLDEIDITATDDVGDSTISGAVLFSRILQSGSFAQRAAKAGSNLTITDAGITESLSRFDISSTQSVTGSAYSTGNKDQYVIVDPSYLSGALTITIQQPISGVNLDTPNQGKLVIKAQDGSQIIMTITDGDVDLEVDTNGDETIDGTISTTWEDIN
jgi:hypothetical protein